MTSGPRTYGHLIDGTLIPGESRDLIKRFSPASDELVATFAEGTVADIDHAVSIARQEFARGGWRNRPAAERQVVLNRWADLVEQNAERIAAIEVEEVGKPIVQARGGLAASVDLIRYAASLTHSILDGSAHTDYGRDYSAFVLREPVGVVAAIVPWNFPALLYCQKVPFALAAGCSVIAKPSEYTSSSAIELTLLAHAAGVPGGALGVLTGYGRSTGARLAGAKGVDFVSFTGSTLSGTAVMSAAATNLTDVSLELGGKGANILFPDADLEAAVDAILVAAYFNQGQCCSAGSRIVVHRDIAGEVKERLVAESLRLVVGDPTDPRTDIGAMIHGDHLRSVMASVDQAESQGARRLTAGGQVWPLGEATGSFFSPVVLDQVDPDMAVFQREIFGPVVSITEFDSDRGAVDFVNDSDYGLAHSIWTADFSRAMSMWRDLRCGTVWVNTSMETRSSIPFGGVASSGFGSEMGADGGREFTVAKALHVRTTPSAGFFQPS